MPNGPSTIFLNGQALKAESFSAKTFEDLPQIRPLVPEITTSAMQVENQRVISQGKAYEAGRLYEKIVAPKYTVMATAALKPRQIWEGIVVNCTATKFIARIVDRTNPSNPEEVAEFESEEVSDDDRQLIKPGASFYWTVGTERSPAGQIRNVAIVNFRRTPRWSRASIQKASKRAKAIAAVLERE